VRIFVAYPGHSLSTFDVAEGWHQALKRLGHEVYHMNYEWNVPFYGAVLNYWKRRVNPDFTPGLRDVMYLASQDLICKVLECMPLDFVLFVTGLLHHPRAFELIQKMGVKTVLLFTESPYNDDLLAELLPLPDAVFTNDKNSIEPFREVNANSFYMPHSYDPERHRLPDEPIDGEYKHDIFFLGSLYDERKALFDELLKQEIRANATLDIWGSGMRPTGDVFLFRHEWPDIELDGGMPNSELVKHYWGSKIVLSPNRTTADYFAKTQIKEEAYSMGPRVYEVAACGAFQLTDGSRAELFDVFGDTIPVYQNAEHLAQLIDLYINYPRWREEVAERARKQVGPCAFENRATNILLPILKEVL